MKLPQHMTNYLKQTKKICPFSLRKRLTADLTSSLIRLYEEHPDCSESSIIASLGTPEEFLDAYLLALPMEERLKVFNTSKRIQRVIYICTAVFIIVVIVAAIMIVQENAQTAVNYYQEGVIK